MSPFNQVAKNLWRKGLQVIPLKAGTKAPSIDWKKYTTEKVTINEINQWSKIPDANVGVLLGSLSNIICLDFDNDLNNLHKKILNLLPPVTLCAEKVGGKGFTLFFRYSGEKNRTWKLNGEVVIELLSNGRQTVLPPSIHPNGNAYVYKWNTLDEDLDTLPRLPNDFVYRLNKYFKKLDGQQVEEQFNIEDLNSALSYLPSDDYDTWVKVGMAIKSALDDDGFPIWEEWSAKSDKFLGSDDCLKKWNSFNREGISIATVFYWAMDKGFEFKHHNSIIEGVLRVEELSKELDIEDKDKGLSPKLGDLHKHIKFRRQEYSLWTGYSNNGKSDILDSISINLMRQGWKVMFCSFEKVPKKHLLNLLHKLTGKSYADRDKDIHNKALSLLSNKCVTLDVRNISTDIKAIFKKVALEKKLHGLDMVIIDPFNYLSSKYEDNLYRHTKYVNRMCAEMSKKLDIHVALVAHPKTPTIFRGEVPRLTMYSAAGGAEFANVPDYIVAVYRNKDDTTEVDIIKIRDQDEENLGSSHFLFDKSTKRHVKYNEEL